MSGCSLGLILTEHCIFCHIKPCYTEGGVGLVIVSVYCYFPVVDAFREAYIAQHHAVVKAATRDGGVVVREDGFRGRCARVHVEPRH